MAHRAIWSSLLTNLALLMYEGGLTVTLERRIRRVVADWYYSGRSGSGQGAEQLIAALVAELQGDVMATNHNEEPAVMASGDVMEMFTCVRCGVHIHYGGNPIDETDATPLCYNCAER